MRRWNDAAAKGVLRSSHSHFVKATGLRWVSLMLLTPISWVNRGWAFPFLTARAPSERANLAEDNRHKTLTDWAEQLLLVVRRWWPERAIIAVADSGDTALRTVDRARTGSGCQPWQHGRQTPVTHWTPRTVTQGYG